MPVLSINHFNLRADSALTRRLRDFYVDVVGMTEGWRPPFDFPGHWLYLGDQAVLHLVADDQAAAVAAAQRPILDHVAFSCTGLPAIEQGLRQAGVAYRRTQVPGTARVQLFAHDPAGNGVEFNFASADA